ncbi:hypothetical protein FB451DRAFT_434115 [Mycena latifolia]|nr:hypothetical protein FB451DRAFT_434115 [Mycena latifolia]
MWTFLLVLPIPDPYSLQSRRNPFTAPLLTTLEATLPLGSNCDWVFSACQAAPLLTHLYTYGFFPNQFPLSQLTTLHAEEPIPINDFIRLLRDVPGLKDLSVDLGDLSAAGPINATVVAKTLSHLEITSHHWQMVAIFFDQVELPGLEELGISQIDDCSGDEFMSFLSRSSCVLKGLAFVDISMSAEQTIRCFQHKGCNMLERLTVMDCLFLGDRLIQYLTYRQAPFPHTRLRVIELAHFIATTGLLADLAESRILPVAGLPEGVVQPGRLTEFKLTTMTSFEPNEYDRLHRLQAKCEIVLLDD